MAAAASRALEALLFDIGSLDAAAFGGSCVLFTAVALVASYVPARRASRVDPVAALKSE